MKPEWGSKRHCSACGAHFYDMRKPEPVCPKCSTPFSEKKKTRHVEKKVAAPEVVRKDHIDEDDMLDQLDDLDEDIDLDEDDDSFLEDTDDLGDDEGDMSEIMEHMDENDLDDNI